LNRPNNEGEPDANNPEQKAINRIEALKARLAKANARMEAERSKILPPGDYEFVIKSAREEHDEERGYDYLFLRMECNGRQTTSDRFPFTDQMFWKLEELFASLGVTTGEIKDLVGRCGRFVAVTKGEWTIYEYQPLEAVL
jgi:hypothetical protein